MIDVYTVRSVVYSLNVCTKLVKSFESSFITCTVCTVNSDFHTVKTAVNRRNSKRNIILNSVVVSTYITDFAVSRQFFDRLFTKYITFNFVFNSVT